MRFFRFLMRGLDLQTLSCSGQIRLGHWAMAGNSCLREGLCSPLNGGLFFLPLESTRVAGNMLKHSNFHWMKRPKIHIYIYTNIIYYIYYLALQVPFYSEFNFFLTHTPMAVQRDTFAMSQATTTCPTTTTPMPAMLLASNRNMVMFLFYPKNLTPQKQPTWEGDSWSQGGIKKKNIHKGSAVPFAFPGWCKKWRPSG